MCSWNHVNKKCLIKMFYLYPDKLDRDNPRYHIKNEGISLLVWKCQK